MELKYYFIAGIILITMLAKALHDFFVHKTRESSKEMWKLQATSAYLNNEDAIETRKIRINLYRLKMLRYMKWRHLFGVLMITIPTLLAPLVFSMPWGQYGLTMLAAMCMYFGFFNNMYNRLTGQHPAYLGTVDVVDVFLRNLFKIEDDPKNPAKNKHFVLWLRAGIGITGIAILLSILSF